MIRFSSLSRGRHFLILHSQTEVWSPAAGQLAADLYGLRHVEVWLTVTTFKPASPLCSLLVECKRVVNNISSGSGFSLGHYLR